MKPLVSIIIPAYNAEATLGYTLSSLVAQTWQRKEIIVVNDGSTDATAEVAEQFASQGVKTFTIENRGLSGAVNYGYRQSQGDYIQEVDADDLISPDKIERQLAALRPGDDKHTLLSSPWGYFYYRTSRARFVSNSFWQDLSPTEWLLRKFGENLHMQNATWLVRRELVEIAGLWDESLNYDQDGEYFARVVTVSAGIRFVPEGRVYYRASGSGRISQIGNSDKKKESLLRSMKLHIGYIRSLEDSERVRKACVTYLQNWYHNFYLSRPDLAEEARNLATQLGGSLKKPTLRKKFAWMEPVLGWEATNRVQNFVPELKSDLKRFWDRKMFERERKQSP